MTGAAVPFVLTAYALAGFMITLGVARAEWANLLAGIIVLVSLTAALTA